MNANTPHGPHRWRRLILALPLAAAAAAQRADDAVPPPPRLVVVCAVDQLARWVFDAAQPFFAADGGFRRLQDQGVSFDRCAFAHACTETGPGHATIGTGASARVHGIVKNEWFDPQLGRKVYCVGDPSAAALDGMPEGVGRSAANLLVPTVGDLLKQRAPAARVASVAYKDRSAILLGGARADAVVWVENQTGRFVTGPAWGAAAPEWLRALQRDEPIRRWFGWTWDRSGPEAAYAGLVDDRPFEIPHPTTGKHTLPAVLTGGRADEPGPRFYTEVYLSPVGNELVFEAALAALVGEQLGQDDVPDLLCVSFSCLDTVGHYFGPDSVEARDTLLRLDLLLARLLTALDDRVGRGRWALVLTSDHGVALPPEVAKAQGLGGGRELLGTRAGAAAERALRSAFGGGDDGDAGSGKLVCSSFDGSLCLDRDALQRWAAGHGEDAHAVIDRAAAIAAAAVGDVRGIARGVSVRELLRTGPDTAGDGAGDPGWAGIHRALWEAARPDRTGDVVYVVEPYWIEAGIPASHGSPHAYDREVPLLATGPDLRAGRHSDAAVTPGLAAVLAARWLALERPAAAAAGDRVPEAVLTR